MVLFHGSDNIIERPKYRGGKPYNDYGYGFYCTEFFDLAGEWAVSEEHDGFINSYEFDSAGLSVLNLSDHSVLSWLAVLLVNRTFATETALAKEAKKYIISEFLVDYESYDVVRGYRADDSYFSFAQDFVNNSISVEQLKKAMYLGKLGDQIVIRSEKAFSHLKYLDAEKVFRDQWLEKKINRDMIARNSYFAMNREQYIPGEIYVAKILDEEMKKDDSRLR